MKEILQKYNNSLLIYTNFLYKCFPPTTVNCLLSKQVQKVLVSSLKVVPMNISQQNDNDVPIRADA